MLKKILFLPVFIFFLTTLSQAQQVFAGKVLDAAGIPLAGVTITAGTPVQQVVTDALGQFAFSLSEAPVRLQLRLPEQREATVELPGAANVLLRIAEDWTVAVDPMPSGSRQ